VLSASTTLLVAFFALSPTCASPANACSFVDLWTLARADLIVVGKVEDVDPTLLTAVTSVVDDGMRLAAAGLVRLEFRGPGGDIAFVASELGRAADHLRMSERFFVSRFLVGNVVASDDSARVFEGSRIRLHHANWQALFPGQQTLIFASRDRGKFYVWGSTGAIPITSANELDELLAAVSAARQAVESGDAARRLEWFLYAATLPAARPYVLERLDTEELSPAHKSQLVESIVNGPLDARSIAHLLDAIGCFEDPRVDRLAIAAVEAAEDLLWVPSVRSQLDRRLDALNGVCPENPRSCDRTAGVKHQRTWEEIVATWYPGGIPEELLDELRRSAQEEQHRWKVLESKFTATYERWR
jgi:hypothetical protein